MRYLILAALTATCLASPVLADPTAEARARAALALSSVPTKTADPCVECGNCVCAPACDCAFAAASTTGYQWVQYSPPDPSCVSLHKNGSQCGAWSFLAQRYRPLNADGSWGAWQALPPCPMPVMYLDKWEETCRKGRSAAAASTLSSQAYETTYSRSDVPNGYYVDAASTPVFTEGPASRPGLFRGGRFAAGGSCASGSCGR
jgi:hypothetical protein